MIDAILFNRYFAPIADVITIIGLGFAIFGVFSGLKLGQQIRLLLERAARSEKNLDSLLERLTGVAQELRRVAGSLTTRPLSPFPHFLPAIQKLAGEAKEEIIMMSGFPGFAAFSALTDWESLGQTLLNKQLNEGIRVCLITGTPRNRQERFRDQFPQNEADWSNWIKQPANSEKLDIFCKRHGFKLPSSGQHEWFEKKFEEVQSKIQNDVFLDKSSVKLTGEYFTILAWIVDGRRAVFCLATPEGASPAFYTEDESLVGALKQNVEKVVKGFWPLNSEGTRFQTSDRVGESDTKANAGQ